jgi:hypothetical protein
VIQIGIRGTSSPSSTPDGFHPAQLIVGPLGKFTGFYTLAAPMPVAKVTMIIHRLEANCEGFT